MSKTETKFVDFLRGCAGPKLVWIRTQLDALKVTHQHGGVCIAGPILQVNEEQLVLAQTVLTAPVGMMDTGGLLTDENIKVMELRDDHPFFMLGPKNTEVEVVTPLDLPEESIDDIMARLERNSPLADAPTLDEIIGEAVSPETAVPNVPEVQEGSIPDVTATDDKMDPDDPLGLDEIVDPGLADSLEVEGNPEPDEVEDPFAEDTDEADDLWATDDEAEATEENPELDYLRANKAIPNEEVQYAGVPQTVLMFEVGSANISRIGARIKQEDQVKCTLYAEFKGGVQPYRYAPVATARFNELLGEAVRKSEGRQEASVGSLFHHLIKVEADDGKIGCQRLADGKWVNVLPKKDRLKVVKDKHKGD